MSRKHQLRTQRAGTVINRTSTKQESAVMKALLQVAKHLSSTFRQKITLVHEKQWLLKKIVEELRHSYPDIEFHYHFDTSSIRPTGHPLHQGAPRQAHLPYSHRRGK